MKATDLMIGDWVDIRLLDDKPEEHMYSQVEQLLECEIDADFETSYDNVYPIPLTSEILEKNGFKKIPYGGMGRINALYDLTRKGQNQYYVYFDCYLFKWIFAVELPTCNGVYMYTLKEFNFVHFFQHILKDFEIEKEIVI